MYNVDKQTLKEYLLKAYQAGQNDVDPDDHRSYQMREVAANEEVSELADNLMRQLAHMFEWCTRLNFIRLKRYETKEDKDFKKQIVSELSQDLSTWVEKKLNENKNN